MARAAGHGQIARLQIVEVDVYLGEEAPNYYVSLGPVGSFGLLLWRVQRVWLESAGSIGRYGGGGGEVR